MNLYKENYFMMAFSEMLYTLWRYVLPTNRYIRAKYRHFRVFSSVSVCLLQRMRGLCQRHTLHTL